MTKPLNNKIFIRTILDFFLQQRYYTESSAVQLRYKIKFDKPTTMIIYDFCKLLFENDQMEFQQLARKFNEIYTINELKYNKKTTNILKKTNQVHEH